MVHARLGAPMPGIESPVIPKWPGGFYSLSFRHLLLVVRSPCRQPVIASCQPLPDCFFASDDAGNRLSSHSFPSTRLLARRFDFLDLFIDAHSQRSAVDGPRTAAVPISAKTPANSPKFQPPFCSEGRTPAAMPRRMDSGVTNGINNFS